MQKILEISSEHFLTGISPYAHLQNQGLFYKAKGVWPYVSFSYESSDVGLLQACSAPISVTTSDVVGSMVQDVQGGGGTIYAHDFSGNIYSIAPVGFTKTCLRETATISGAVGAAIYNREYLYAQQTQIGAFNLVSTWNDSKYGLLHTTTNHQMHQLGDMIFIADRDRVSKLSINSTGTTVLTTGVLDFDPSFRNTCLDDDGRYLIAGITQNQGDNAYGSLTKVVFWDTTSDSWNKEWTIPDTSIVGITKDDLSHIAICGRGIYRFSYDSKPQLILPLTSYESITYGYPDAASEMQNLPLWGSWGITGEINAYGSPTASLPKSVFTPVTNLSGAPTAILANGLMYYNFIATSGSPDRIYRWNTTTGGGTGVNAQTVAIDLKQKYNIRKIVVTFGRNLASGDIINLDIASNISSTATDWGTASYTEHGAQQEVSLPGFFKTKLLSLVINYVAGSPKVKRIQVFGEPDPTY